MKMIPFNFENHEVRASDRDGASWFVAADVCAALDIVNVSQAVDRLDPDEKGICSIDTLGGRQELLVVNESGMYALALRARDAMTPGTVAHRFRKWVTADVLPTIRKTGGYGAAASPEDIARIASEAAWSAAMQAVGVMLPELIKAHLASGVSIRNGRSAGEIWRSHGLPPIKNGAQWLANRLKEMGAALADDARGEAGLTTVRMFDADRANACMRNGLLDRAKRYVSERAGQGVLKLVQPNTEARA